MRKLIACFPAAGKWWISVSLLILSCLPLLAIPASKRPIQVRLPDGSTLTVRLHGDEFFSWYTTVDGYLINRNADGFFEYVSEVGTEGERLSGIKVRDVDVRSSKEIRFLRKLDKTGIHGQYQDWHRTRKNTVSLDSLSGGKSAAGSSSMKELPRPKGNYQTSDRWLMKVGHRFAGQNDFLGIMVPVNFPDVKLTYSQMVIDSAMNYPGYDRNGAKGSVYDYFQDMSHGKFHFQVKVLPPYTALKKHDQYFDNAGDLKSEVFEYVSSLLGDDWYTYDRNADGHIDHISILFAGYGKENTAVEGSIWSHNSYTNYDGYNYACVNISCIAELDNFDGVQGIETYCHEFGHALGLPDYYGTLSGGSPENLPAQHALMSANTVSGYPVPMSAVSQWILGWVPFKDLTAQTPGIYTLSDLTQGGTVYRYHTPVKGEFFVLDYRSKQNKWQNRPDLGEGLLIFRVDSTMYVSEVDENRVNSMEYGAVTVMRADNDESYGSFQGDYFGSDYASFTDDTRPSSRSRSGMATGLPLTDISENGGNLNFQFVSSTPHSLVVHTGEYQGVQENIYRMSGGYTVPDGMECTESGICYSLLPSPGISGSKVINEGNSSEFSLELNLSSYDPGAIIHARAYAKDGAGKVYYGTVRKIEVGALEALKVDSYLYATVENGLMTRIYSRESGIGALLLRKLDISAMDQPMLETPVYYGNPEGEEEELRTEGYVMLSTDEGVSWKRLDATGIRAVDKYSLRAMFPLPAGAESLLVKVIGNQNVGAGYDSVIVREGSPYVWKDAEIPVVYMPSSPLGNYHDYTLDTFQGAWVPAEQIYTFNTSHMEVPALRFHYPAYQTSIFIRTDSGLFRGVSPTNICGKLPYQMGRIAKSGNVVSDDYSLMPLATVTLPKAERVYVWVKTASVYEWEVFDLGRTGARLHSVRSLDNSTVEISYSRAIDFDDMGSHYEESGICWSTGTEPSLENSMELPLRNYSVVPVTDLPAHDIRFWTYTRRDGRVIFSEEPLVSRVVMGERENRVNVDSLTAMCPIAWTPDGAGYVARVVYPDFMLEGAVAQGICHAWDKNPDITSESQYHEGEIRKVEYYELSYSKTGYNFYIRPFTMTSGGSISYGRAWKWDPCQMENPELRGMVYRAPVDLCAEALREYGENMMGYDYWRGHLNRRSVNGFDVLSVVEGKDGKVQSPLIDLSQVDHPVMHMEIFQESQDWNPYWDVWAVGFRSGERTYLTALDGTWKTKDISLSGVEDSVFIELTPQNIFAREVMITSWSIQAQQKPLVTTLLPVSQEDSLLFYGSVELNDNMEEVEEYGFIYSPQGDPLVALEEGNYDYYKAVCQTMESGQFSFRAYQPELSYNYVRAYARNSFGTSYGECQKVLQCGTYEVSAVSLPVNDPLGAVVYTEDHQPYQISSFCDECHPSEESLDFFSGQLRLQNPPRVNKIHALFEFYVQVDASDPARNDPEQAVFSRMKVTYRTATGTEDLHLPEGSRYAFVGESFLIGGAYNLNFEVETDLPRDFSHFRIEYNRVNSWLFQPEEIQYTESDQVDNYVATPYLSFLSVEEDRNVVNWKIEDLSHLSAVRIYREGTQLEQWEKVAEFTSGWTTGVQAWVDQDSRPQTRSYRYKVVSVNSEGVEFSSSVHKSIHLSINKGVSNQWNLLWNPYEGRTVSTIYVYRSQDGTDFTRIDEVNGGNTSYTDVNAPEGDVFYRVEYVFADEVSGKNRYTSLLKSSDVSRSNIATNRGTGTESGEWGDLSLEKIKVFPNPVRTRMRVELPCVADEGVLLDQNGREVLRSVGFQTKEWNLSGFEAGIYFLELRKGGKTVRVKVVKS